MIIENTPSTPNNTSEADQMPERFAPAKAHVSFLDVLIELAERKWLIIRVTIATTMVGIVLSLVLPKRYTATVSLLTPQQNTSLSTALQAQLGNLSSIAGLAGGGLGLKNPNDIYVAMLQSRTLEDAMVQKFNLMREYHAKYPIDGRKALESHSNIDGTGKDGLIHISVSDSDPRRAAAIANGYVDQFRKLSQHLAITEASQRRLFFEQQLEHAKDNLADAEEALQKTEQKTGLIQLDSQARALIQSAASLRAQIAAKEVEIQSLETFATNQNAQLLQAQSELDGLRAQLSKLESTSDKGGVSIIVPKNKVPEAGLEYVRRMRDVKYNETIFEILARQFEAAKLDEARQGALIQVVDVAVPPERRSFPKRVLMTIGAAVFGFLIGIGAALIDATLKRLEAEPLTMNKVNRFRQKLLARR